MLSSLIACESATQDNMGTVLTGGPGAATPAPVIDNSEIAIAFSSPATSPSTLDPALQAAFPVAGVCTAPNRLISLVMTNGGTQKTATVNCLATNSFATTLDLSTFPMGTISVSATLTNAAATKTASATISVIKTVVGPSNTSLLIDGGAAYTSSGTVTLTLGASGASEMYITNTAGCAAGGSWQAYAATRAGWALANTNALNSVYVKFRNAGLVESACLSATIVHDDMPPAVAISAPAALYTNASSPAQWNVGFTGALQSITMAVADLVVTTTGTASCTGWSITGSGVGNSAARTVAASCTGNGTVKFSIKAGVAADFAGNTSLVVPASTAVTVDNAVPTNFSVTTPAAGSTLSAAAVTTINWSATTDSNFAATPISLYYSPDAGVTWEVIAANVPNSGNFAWLTPSVDGTQYRLKVRATDLAGNLTEVQTGNFSIDSSVPSGSATLAFIQPATNPVTLDPALQTAFPVSGICSEINQPISFTATLGATVENYTTTCDAQNHFSTSLDLSTFGIGTIQLAATHTRFGGSVTASASTQIQKLSAGPSVPTLTINGGAAFTNAATVSLSLGAVSASEMYVTNTAGCSGGGAWQSYATSISGWALPSLNAANTIYAKFRDSQNNESTCVSASITHDNSPPSLAIGSPNVLYARSATTVSWNLSLTGATQSISLGAPDLVLATTGTASCTWNVSGSGVGASATRTVTASSCSGEGSISFSVKAGVALDFAGNTSAATTSSGTTVIDNTAPAGLAVTSPSTGAMVAGGSPLTISWSPTSDTNLGSRPVSIDWSSDAGTTWNLLASNLNDSGSFSWIVPTASGPNYQIRVTSTDLAGNSASVSSGSFTVKSTNPAAPTIALVTTSPGTTTTPTLRVSGLETSGSVAIYTSSTCANTELRAQVSISGASTDVTVSNALPLDGTYVFYAKQWDGAGLASPCSTTGVTYILNRGPPTPTGLAAVPGAANVALTWNVVAGATSYSVYRSTTSGSGYSLLTSGLQYGNHTDLSALNGTTYYYVVRAVNALGTSAGSSEVSATPIAMPGAPSGLTATMDGMRVNLSWAAGSDAASYTVRRGTATGGPYVTVANGVSGTTYQDSLPAVGIYYFVVTATNTSGTSPYSNEVASTSAAAPAGFTLTAMPGNASVYLTYTFTGTRVRLWRSTQAGGPYTLITETSATSYMDTGLTNGVRYYYTASTINAGNESGKWSEVNVLPEARTLAAPSELSAVAGGLTLGWKSSSSSPYFNVKRSLTPGGPYTTISTNLTATTMTDGGCPSVCYYVVTSVWGGVESPPSNEIFVRNVGGPWPGITLGNTSLTISWGATAGAVAYELRRSEGLLGTMTVLATNIAGLTYTDSTVAPDVLYNYDLIPIFADGSRGVPGGRMPGMLKTDIIATPTNLLVWGSQNQLCYFMAMWDYMPEATQYVVEYSNTSSTGPWVSATVSTNTYNPGNNGNCYNAVWVRVSAKSGLQVSDPSPAQQVNTIPYFNVGFTIQPGNASLNLSWGAPIAGGTVASYELYRADNFGEFAPRRIATGITGLTYTDTGLTNGKTYVYYLVAVDPSGNRFGYLTSAQGVPMGTLGLDAPVLNRLHATLNWQRSNNAYDYVISRGTSAAGPFTQIGTALCCSYNITNPDASTYYYVVQARYGATLLSSNSNAVSMPFNAFAASRFFVSPGNTDAHLVWDAFAGADNYQVEVRTSYFGNPVATYTTGNVTQYTVSGLTNGTQYYFRLIPKKGTELEDRHMAGNVYPMLSTMPTAIAAVPTPVPQIWQNGVFTWSASPDVELFQVRYSTTSGGPYTTVDYVPTSALSVYTYQPASCTVGNTICYYQVRSRRGSLFSAWTAEMGGFYTSQGFLTATPGATSVALSWGAAGGTPTGYTIYRSTQPTAGYTVLVASQAGTTYTDSAVTPGTTYFYRVRTNYANNTYGALYELNTGNATVYGVTPGNNSPAIKYHGWIGANGQYCFILNNVPSATQYKLYSTTTSGTGYSVAGTNTIPVICINPPTTAGVNTYYATTAVVGTETGYSSEVGLTVNANTFNLAYNSRPYVSAGAASVTLSWGAVTGATAYIIERKGTNEATAVPGYTTIASGVTGTSYTDSTVVAGMRYDYNVRPVFSGLTSIFEMTSATTVNAGLILYATPGFSPTSAFDFIGAKNASTNTNGLTFDQGAHAPVSATRENSMAYQECQVRRATVPGGPYTVVYVGQCGGVATVAGGLNGVPLVSTRHIWGVTDVPAPIAGTTYYYGIRRSVDGYQSNWSADIAGRPGSAFASGLAGTPGLNSVALSWTAISGASTYEIARTPGYMCSGNAQCSGFGYGSYFSAGAGLTYNDTGFLTSYGHFYYYYVRAIYPDGSYGPWSNNAIILPNGTVTAPVPTPVLGQCGSTGSGASRSVYLCLTNDNTMNASISGAPTRTINYYRGTSATGPWTLQTCTAIAGGLIQCPAPVGTSYYFMARNAAGGAESANSNVVQVSASLNTGLLLSSVTWNSSSVSAAWGALAGATSYVVHRQVNASSFQYFTSTTSLSFTDSTVITSNRYTYRICPVIADGMDNCAVTGGITPSSIQLSTPAAPFIYANTINNTAVTVCVSPVAGATSYNVYRSTVSGSYAGVSGGLTSPNCWATNVTAVDVTNYYMVRAVLNGTESPNSPEVAIKVPSSMTFQFTQQTAGNAQATIAWNAVAGAAGYAVYRQDGEVVSLVLLAANQVATSYTDTGLVNGRRYRYLVRPIWAANVNGPTTAYSNWLIPSASALGIPGAPNVLGVTATSVNLGWNTVPGATSYGIYRSSTPGGPYTLQTTTTALTWNNTGLTAATNYYYVFKAFNSYSDSGFSPEVAAFTTATAAVAPTAVAGNGVVNVSWPAVAGATGYQLVRYVGQSTAVYGDATILVSSQAGVTYTDNAVVNGQQYFYCYNAIFAGSLGSRICGGIVTPLSAKAFESGFELMDTGFSSYVGVGITRDLSRTSTYVGASGTTDYSNNAASLFEIVATNTDNAIRAIQLNCGNAIAATINVPAGVSAPTRYSTTLASWTGNSCMIRVTGTTTLGQLKVYSARLVVRSGATGNVLSKAIVNYPLTAPADATVLNSGDDSAYTAEVTTDGFQPISGAGIFFKDSAANSQLLSAFNPMTQPWMLQVVAGSIGGASGSVVLYNRTTGQPVYETEISVVNSSIPTLQTITFYDTASNFGDQEEYELRARCYSGCGGSNKILIYHASLNQSLWNISKVQLYQRVGAGVTTTGSAPILSHRRLYDSAYYSSPQVFFQAVATLISGSAGSANLQDVLAADSGTAGATTLSNSGLSFNSNSRTRVRSSQVFPTTGNRVVPQINGSGNSLQLHDSVLILNVQ